MPHLSQGIKIRQALDFDESDKKQKNGIQLAGSIAHQSWGGGACLSGEGTLGAR